jgi:hypothetical protein
MEHKELHNEWDDSFNPSLKKHMHLHLWQKIGVSFLHECHKQFGFTLLADDMGIGKVCPFYKLRS